MKNELVRDAGATALFGGLSAAALESLLGQIRAVRRTYRKGEVIVYEGTEARTIYLVVSGRVVITELADGSRGHVVRDLGPGAGFGLTLLFASGWPPPHTYISIHPPTIDRFWNTPYGAYLGSNQIPLWPGTVEAVEETVLIGFDLVKARQLCAKSNPAYHQVFINMTRLLCEHLANVWLKLAVLDCHSIKDRVMLYLKRLDMGGARTGEVTIPFDRERMARYLGVNRTALSRALTQLKAAGRLDWRKNVFILKGSRT